MEVILVKERARKGPLGRPKICCKGKKTVHGRKGERGQTQKQKRRRTVHGHKMESESSRPAVARPARMEVMIVIYFALVFEDQAP